MTKRAFTLIELLVVIAIISVLTTMLLPGLSAAKEAARRAVCASNLRQLAIANHGYANENAEFFVPAAEDIFNPNNQRWHGRRDSSAEPFDPARGPLKDYLGSGGLVKECPSFRTFLDKPGGAAAFEAGCGGYGYNQSYIGGRADLFGMSPPAARTTARESDVKSQAETVMFTDSAFAQSGGGYIAYSFCEPPFWQISEGPPSNMRPNPTIHFRHRGYCNVVWVDGHVEARTMAFSADYLTHSMISADQAVKLGLGWFGGDSNDLFDCQ